MKKMWPVLVTLIVVVTFLWIAGTSAIAMDQCEVAGNSYTLDGCTLDFVESGPFFSPAPQCAGTAGLAVPGWDIVVLDWMVVRDNLTVAGYPAVLTPDGLIIYGIPTNLHTLNVGGKTYMTEHEVPLLLFK